MQVDDTLDDDDLAETMDQAVTPRVPTMDQVVTPRAPDAPAPMPVAPDGWTTHYLLAVLVLIAAGGATAVVYFALP
jgi:hypothetical protein